MIQRMLAIWSLVPLPFVNPAWTIWKFMAHILLKPGLENFEHYFTHVTHVTWVQLCSNLSILWHCLSLRLEWKLELTSLAQYHDDHPETFQTDSIPKAIPQNLHRISRVTRSLLIKLPHMLLPFNMYGICVIWKYSLQLKILCATWGCQWAIFYSQI